MSVVPNKAPTVYIAWQASSGTLPSSSYPLSRSSASNDGTVIAFSACLIGTGGGIYYSTNSGLSFVKTSTNANGVASSGPNDYPMNSVAVSGDGTTIYAVAVNNGIYKYIIGSGWVTTLPSTVSGGAALNLGSTRSPATDAGWTSIACDNTGTNIFVCSTSTGLGTIWYTQNGGSTWAVNGSGINFTDICCNSNGKFVFAVASPASSAPNIYYSGNAGTSFSSTTSAGFNLNELTTVGCSTDGTVVICAGKNIYTSTNGTAGTPTFTINSFSNSATSGWTRAVVSQDNLKLYITADNAAGTYSGGLYYSLDQGATWRYNVPGGTPLGVTVTSGRSITLGSNGYPVTLLSTAQYSPSVQAFWYSTVTVLCFKEGTKILCFVDGKETYLPVETLKPGTLVKTSLDGYKKVDTIGSSKIYNPAHTIRGKNRLYKCTKTNYPEVFEDLVITGCHSILVDDITDTQRKDITELAGRIFVTDNKYRLMACIDERAEPYTEEGIHTIWHFALENDNYYYNYGVYANGLLVETSSKRMIKELSGMELV